MYSERLDKALVYAHEVHRKQVRKGTSIPYVGHLLSVAGIVIDADGTEDEAIAALLHDAAEDQGGEARLTDIRRWFGDRVAEIVRECSDALTDDPTVKPLWRERKECYIEHLRVNTDKSVYLVSAADKLHNARSILTDYRNFKEQLWSRFNPRAGRGGVVWYYDTLLEVYSARCSDDERLMGIVSNLRDTLLGLKRAIADALPDGDDAKFYFAMMAQGKTIKPQEKHSGSKSGQNWEPDEETKKRLGASYGIIKEIIEEP